MLESPNTVESTPPCTLYPKNLIGLTDVRTSCFFNFSFPYLLRYLSKSSNKVPRPLSTTLYASKLNEVIHFYYLLLRESDKREKYALVFKDYPFGYFWLEPSAFDNSKHAASVLTRCTRSLTAPDVWVSGQVSRFKNQLLKHRATIHRICHDLTLAYSSWANWTVESCMVSILFVILTMLPDLKLGLQDRDSELPAIATALNKASLDLLGRRPDGAAKSLLKIMTGVAPNVTIPRLWHGLSKVRIYPSSSRRSNFQQYRDVSHPWRQVQGYQRSLHQEPWDCNFKT